MVLHSVCTTCSLIPYYHPHDIAFCYNVFTYSVLPSTWYCILFVHVHLFHITIHMILHSVCTTCSLIPYYHPHDNAFCVYNVSTYSILPSTWYCILFVQGVHLVHITIHMILHSVCTTCSLIPYYHPHDNAFCLYVFTYSILPSTWYCILFVQHVHLFHITIHMILHSVCTTCSLIPYYHPHDIAFCSYNVFTYSILPSTCCILVQRVPYSILPSTWYAFCLYKVFTYSILPSTWYCILCVQRVHLFHITIHMIAFYNMFTIITIHMILHSVCTTCSLIPYYHPHDIAFCCTTCSLVHITIHMIGAFCVYTYSILPSTWYCIHNVFTSILPSTWYCILLQRVHLFHITIHMILHSVCVFTYSILPSTW